MLARHVFGYLPSLVIPALVSFGAIFCYTHFLSASEFGFYALSLNMMTLFAAAFYYWLQTAFSRLLPQYSKEGREDDLRVTAYVAYLGISLLLVAGGALACMFITGNTYTSLLYLAVPLAVARSLLNLNQAFHRSKLHIKAYNIIECGQAVLGLSLGLFLAVALGWGGQGAVTGLLVGMLCMVLVDISSLKLFSTNTFQKAYLAELAKLGLPMMLTFGLSTLLTVSDKFLVEHFLGAEQLGIYAAGYTLMDRIITMLFMMIATASFPLTIHKLEHEGVEAARQQTYSNGIAVFLISLPAFAGLLLAQEHIAYSLVGPEFRAGVAQVIPLIACSAILNGLTTHYFDHAFYLAKKPHLLIFSQGPSLLLNLVLNLWLIPHYGIKGAAAANVVSYVCLLMLSFTIGRKVFPIKVPYLPLARIAAATLLMAAVVYAIPFPVSFYGLVMMAATGGLVYLAGLMLLNVGNVRGIAKKVINKRR